MVTGKYRLDRTLAWKIDRLHKYLTIPAINFRACEDNKSLFLANGRYLQSTIPSTLPMPEFTIEFWINPSALNSSSPTVMTVFKHGTIPATRDLLTITNSGIVTYYTASSGLIGRGKKLVQNQWNHVAITKDAGADRKLKIYINGDLVNDYITNTLASETAILQFGDPTTGFTGYLSDIRFWNTERTSDQIKQSYKSPRSIMFSTEPNLVCYWKCNSITAEGLLEDIVGAEHLQMYDKAGVAIADPSPYLSSDVIYPRSFGASISCATAQVDLGKPCSFKFPFKLPSKTFTDNSALVLRWIDDNDVTQRRYLWTTSGVDFGGVEVTEYAGEKLNNPFYIEVWGTDGEAIITTAEAVSINLSLTTMPTTSVDNVQQKETDITLNNLIYSPIFPLSFPITFNNAPDSGAIFLNVALNGGDLLA